MFAPANTFQKYLDLGGVPVPKIYGTSAACDGVTDGLHDFMTDTKMKLTEI